jgi:outer membrane protein assembly factor BamA
VIRSWTLFSFFLLHIGLLYAQSQGPDIIQVRQIAILGNDLTKPQVISREMTLQEGDTVSLQRLEVQIERSRQNIFNLALFNEVRIQHEIVSDQLYLIVEVKERWYLFPIPNLDLEERNTYDILRNRNLHRLVYGLNLEWKNVTGRNELLNFYGQLGFSQRFYVDFERPAIIPSQFIDLLIKARYIREPEIIYGTKDAIPQWGATYTEPLRKINSLRVGLRKRFGDVRKSLYLEAGYHHYQFADSLPTFNPSFIPTDQNQIQYPSLVVTFANDQRDYKAFPLKGFKYQLLFRQVGLGNENSTTFTKLGATWAHHLPLNKRWNFTYGTHLMFSFGENIPFFEKNFIGYRTGEFRGISYDVRGYDPYTIDGSFLNMTKFELKYALFPIRQMTIEQIPFKKFQTFPLGVFLTAFSDFGYVRDNTFNNQDQFLKNQLLAGYGLGLNIIGFYDNLLRIELTRNHLNQTGIYLHGLVSIK